MTHQYTQSLTDLSSALARIVIDQSAAIRYAVMGIIGNGHILIEDLPGTGKTTLARSLAQACGLSFKRIQGTPDKMPTEVTGSSIADLRSSELKFIPGPLFAQMVLFDEINRATPKTQSALLEAMEEGQVTVDNVTYPLPRPFLVIATQNPIELEGTFPLPEAAMDRFFLRFHMSYPSVKGERFLHQHWHGSQREQATTTNAVPVVLTQQQLAQIQQFVTSVTVSTEAEEYLLQLIIATRNLPTTIRYGLSPRAGLLFRRAAQACAALAGRDYVTPDDIREVFPLVGAHRLQLLPSADIGQTPERILIQIADKTDVPGSWAAGAGKRK